MLVIEGLNFNLIGKAKLELTHKYAGMYEVKDGEQIYQTTKMTCTCCQYGCQHQQAVKEAETERLKDTGVVPWYRMKGKALKQIAREAKEGYLTKEDYLMKWKDSQYHNGVYLDPEIEF